jgi:hypothetical protein
MLLACVGKEAFETFQTMEFADEADREDEDKVMAAFQNYCVGEVNVTYIFNQRTQETGESFESFLSGLRKLERTCEYSTIEDSIVKDRIVCGIRDDATRRKLLQMRKLTLATAVDICKAKEATSK